MVVLIVICFLIIGYIELKPLYRNEDMRGFWLSSCFMAITLVIAILVTVNWKIPSLASVIRGMIESLTGKQ